MESLGPHGHIGPNRLIGQIGPMGYMGFMGLMGQMGPGQCGLGPGNGLLPMDRRPQQKTHAEKKQTCSISTHFALVYV